LKKKEAGKIFNNFNILKKKMTNQKHEKNDENNYCENNYVAQMKTKWFENCRVSCWLWKKWKRKRIVQRRLKKWKEKKKKRWKRKITRRSPECWRNWGENQKKIGNRKYSQKRNECQIIELWAVSHIFWNCFKCKNLSDWNNE